MTQANKATEQNETRTIVGFEDGGWLSIEEYEAAGGGEAIGFSGVAAKHIRIPSDTPEANIAEIVLERFDDPAPNDPALPCAQGTQGCETTELTHAAHQPTQEAA